MRRASAVPRPTRFPLGDLARLLAPAHSGGKRAYEEVPRLPLEAGVHIV
jgi:hypothetical protein